MLFEEEKLIPSEKEIKLQIYINKLIYELYNNEKTEVDSKKLLELLSYLTSDENISTQMKSCVEVQNRKITDILHKREVEHLKKHIEYLKENSVLKQKVIDRINYYDTRIKHAKQIRDKEQEEFYIDIKKGFYKLLEDK